MVLILGRVLTNHFHKTLERKWNIDAGSGVAKKFCNP